MRRFGVLAATCILTLAALWSTAATGAGPTLTAEERAWLEAHSEIVLGPDPTFRPVEFFDANGRYRGLAADTMALLEDKLGLRFRVRQFDDWQESLAAARERRIDAWPAAVPTPQRTDYMRFTAPYLEVPAVIIVRNETDRPLTPDDLQGMRVAVAEGYAAHDHLRQTFPDLTLVPVPDVPTGLRKVSFGEVPALVANLAVASHYIGRDGIDNLRVAGEAGYTYRWAVGVRRDRPMLATILQKGLDAITPAERQAIKGRWIALEVKEWRPSPRLIAIAAGVLIVVAALAVLAWNLVLRHRVGRATRDLSAELARRTRAEADARRARDRAELYLSVAGVMMVALDRDGTITLANRRACEVLGWDEEALLGSDWFDTVIPADVREEIRRVHREVVAGRLAPVQSYANEVITRGGERRLIAWTNTPLRDHDGVIQGSLSSGEDITERQRAEAALRRNEAWLRLITDNVPAWIAYLDPQFRYRFANATYYRLGHDPQTMIGRAAAEVIGQEVFDRARPYFMRALQGETVSFDATLSLADGTPAELVVTLTPDADTGGRVRGVYLLGQDVTEQHRVEEHLRKSLAFTEALRNVLRLAVRREPLEAILQGALEELVNLPCLDIEKKALVFLLDESGETLSMAASTGLDPAARDACGSLPLGHCLCGRAARDNQVIFRSELDADHEIDVPEMPDHGHYCVPIGGADRVFGVLSAYVQAEHPWNEEEEMFLRMMADALGAVIERHKAELRLRESEEVTRALLDAPTDATFLIDLEGRLLALNKALADRFDTTVEALLGTDIFDLFPPEVAERRRAHVNQAIEQDRPLRTTDEREGRVLDNHIFPVHDPSGAVTRVAVVSRDVTVERRAEQQIAQALDEARRSNEELEQFAYVASHDLREPLRMITSYLQLLDQRHRDSLPDDAQEFVDFAVDGAKRMDGLIRDLLDYSRIGRKDAEMAPVSLADAVAGARANLAAAIDETGAEVRVAEDLPVVMGSEHELVRLLQNLIGNAIKYRDPERPPVIDVGVERRDEDWLFSVADNGIGIEPKNAERVFMIFQRLHGVGQYEGTGIGLAVCKKTVERHGGRIWVESEPGRGSTFFFTLPAAG